MPLEAREIRKSFNPPQDGDELHRAPLGLLRSVLIVVAYLTGFIILDILSQRFQELRGIVAWYPPTGLTYALLLVFGTRFTPAVTIALLISSLFVYRMPQPLYLLFLWSLIISLIYGGAAWFLRHRIRFDWHLGKLRDVTYLVVTAVFVSALLAVLSVTSSALSSDIPRSEIFRESFLWWIGETVGVLTVTPFLFIHVMPRLKRFVQRQPTDLAARQSFPRLTLSVIGQAFSMVFVFYWVFGGGVLNEFRPIYLIALPLIWIALDHGLKGVTAGIAVLNFGLMLAMLFLRFDLAHIGELQLLMIVNCIVGLLMGAVVTDRKRVEQELVSLAKYPAENPNPVLRLSQDGIILHANPASGALLRMWGSVVGGSAPEFWRNLATESLASGENRAVDTKCDGKDYSFFVAPGSNREYVNLYGRDITDRMQMEKSLLNERNLMRTLIDNLPDSIYAKDIEGRFTVENLSLARLMGASSTDEALGKTDFDYFPPELAAQYRADDQVVIRSGQPLVNREETIVDATGGSGWILTSKVPLRDKNGEVIGLVGIGHDITILKQSQAKIENQLQQLAALRAIDTAISGNLDLRVTMNILLGYVTSQLLVDAAAVLLINEATSELEYAAGCGFRGSAITRARVRLSETIAWKAILERRMLIIPNLAEAKLPQSRTALLAGEEFVGFYAVPLITKGRVIGVLEIFHRAALDPDPEWLNFLETLAGQAAIATDNLQLFDGLQRSNMELKLAYDATIEGWSQAMDLRDKETEGHTQRVTEGAVKLAWEMHLPEKELTHLRRGALLHDIGKMGVPDAVLLKPEPLTDDEWVLMRKHPDLAHDMLSHVQYLQPAIDIPYCHHEKWDGTGYPRGLKGEQIPLPARIFAIIDVWDALTSDRPYRKAWSKEKALQYIQEESGQHFDPQVVDAFLQISL